MLKASVSPALAEQYADMHALDFRRRQSLLGSFFHNFDDLCQWDAQLSNYMQGLELLAEDANGYFQNQLLSPLNVGDVFTIALFSERTGNHALLEGCLSLTQALPSLTPAIKTLIKWIPTTSSVWQLLSTYPFFKALIMHLRPEISQHYQLSETDIERLWGNDDHLPWLIYALFKQHHPHVQMITKKLLLTGTEETKIAVLEILLRHHIPMQDKEEVLLHLLSSTEPDIVRRAVRLFTLYTNYSSANYHSIITPDHINKRIYIEALGWAGYASDIPVLMDYFDEPDYARISAMAVITITGSLPEQSGWGRKDAPIIPTPLITTLSEIPKDDPDCHLTWPDKDAFVQWWQQYSYRFDMNNSYLNGLSTNDVLPVLYHGSLALRQLAAERLWYQQSPFKIDTSTPTTQQIIHLAKAQKRTVEHEH